MAPKNILRSLKMEALNHVKSHIAEALHKQRYKGVEKIAVQRQFFLMEYQHVMKYNMEAGAKFIVQQAEAKLQSLAKKNEKNIHF